MTLSRMVGANYWSLWNFHSGISDVVRPDQSPDRLPRTAILYLSHDMRKIGTGAIRCAACDALKGTLNARKPCGKAEGAAV
jgi:hypothetical protein